MRVRLALGGGGVRGFFHLGLLRELKRAGVEVEAIAGTSAGALAAAVFAFGLPLEVEPVLEATKDPELLQAFPGRAAAKRPAPAPGAPPPGACEQPPLSRRAFTPF